MLQGNIVSYSEITGNYGLLVFCLKSQFTVYLPPEYERIKSVEKRQKSIIKCPKLCLSHFIVFQSDTSALFTKSLIQFPLSMLKQEAFFRVLWGVLFFQRSSSDLGNMPEIKSSEG